MVDPIKKTKRAYITVQYEEKGEGNSRIFVRMLRDSADSVSEAVIDTTEDAYCIAAGLHMALDILRGELHGKNEKD